LRNARKIRAAKTRERKSLQPKPKVIERISLSAFVRQRLDDTRRSKCSPQYKHRSSADSISRPDVTSCVTGKVEQQKYTGDKLIGIALMHKSNYVPIFNHEEAVSVAKMRRN
jgi:hypothetical protein